MQHNIEQNSKKIQMTEDETKEWTHVYAELILSAVERELGGLPTPPSKKEFHRLWERHVTNKLYAEE